MCYLKNRRPAPIGDPQPWPSSAISVAETRGQASAAELAEMARIAAKEPLRSALLLEKTEN